MSDGISADYTFPQNRTAQELSPKNELRNMLYVITGILIVRVIHTLTYFHYYVQEDVNYALILCKVNKRRVIGG